MSAVRPLLGLLIVAGVCVLSVLWRQSHPDDERRVAAGEYVEAVARQSCGPRHQDDGCVEDLMAACRTEYGDLCATLLLMSPSAMGLLARRPPPARNE